MEARGVGFERLLEIVSTDPEDRERGRARYRFYQERGYAVTPLDLRDQGFARGTP
jgi:DNA polymerase-3 subunit chi